jgi:membrane-bound ClpP family serine protease
MKLGIALIIIGSALLFEGAVRIIYGVQMYLPHLVFGGLLTGLLLGGGLIFWGKHRVKKARQKSTI